MTRITSRPLLRPILLATVIAGTLDLTAAFLLSARVGVTPGGVLRFVASGPFPPAIDGGAGWAAVGVAVHYGIMFVMAAAFILTAARAPALVRQPIAAGLTYGFGLWLVMYWVVRPLRWPAMWPHVSWAATGPQLFCHLILVGLPIALIARRALR